MNKKIKIVLAEHGELFRKSLVSLLKSQFEFDVVDEATNGKDLLEKLKSKEFDVVLLDIEMPVMNGPSLMEIIQKRFPGIKVIVLSENPNLNSTTEFMMLGASCFLSKNCEVETLYKAIKTVYNEGYYFDNSTSKAMLGALIREKSGSKDSEEAVFNSRETEILCAICDGKTNKEIASSLHLSASTIDFHRTKIYAKAKCNSATGLLKYALKKGLVALT